MLMTGRFVAHSVTVDGVERRYQVWLPAAYDASRHWPAIVFLHGVGERGDDGAAQTTVGLGHALRAGNVDPPAIVVFPQCPLDGDWTARGQPMAMAAHEQASHDYSIDQHRVSLTGLSMGGGGAWALAAEQPDRFSALAPICGWAQRLSSQPRVPNRYTALAERLGTLPIRIFHGSEDPIVPVGESRAMAAVLGAHAVYTEFPGVGHNSWDPAYMTTDVVDWLVKQKRP
jgi:predicted peptidase